ncbi:hypothetical protein [Corynebacterium sp.]|uniref:hypothetical protein n=1 Tax=Corynebacterium sp. TaxID=1720 RepID=UPI0026DBA06D|nr:hypothetical protein [Corynebacterium sp.]MDO5076705.1 hypothetical protein [Corynebacterium sp.]
MNASREIARKCTAIRMRESAYSLGHIPRFQDLHLGSFEEANHEMNNDVMEKLLEWLP